jgi:hypothetical protein
MGMKKGRSQNTWQRDDAGESSRIGDRRCIMKNGSYIGSRKGRISPYFAIVGVTTRDRCNSTRQPKKRPFDVKKAIFLTYEAQLRSWDKAAGPNQNGGKDV